MHLEMKWTKSVLFVSIISWFCHKLNKFTQWLIALESNKSFSLRFKNPFKSYKITNIDKFEPYSLRYTEHYHKPWYKSFVHKLFPVTAKWRVALAILLELLHYVIWTTITEDIYEVFISIQWRWFNHWFGLLQSIKWTLWDKVAREKSFMIYVFILGQYRSFQSYGIQTFLPF